jgi:hypothetical protein
MSTHSIRGRSARASARIDATTPATRWSSFRVRRASIISVLAVVFSVVSATSLGLWGVTTANAAITTMNTATAGSYALVADSTITNTNTPTVINGSIALTPGAAITGFPPGTQASGFLNVDNSLAVQARADDTAALIQAQGESPVTQTISSGPPGEFGGLTLTPGVYTTPSSAEITGTLTLNALGDPNAQWVFQVGSTLTTASASNFVLEGGAQACDVYWAVGSSATLGTNSVFDGTILAADSDTLTTGAVVNGGVFAETGAITLDDNTVTAAACAMAPPPPPPTTTTTVAPTTTTTTRKVIIPVGAPATGFGGTAGGPSPLLPIGLSALALAGVFGAFALRARRHQ